MTPAQRISTRFGLEGDVLRIAVVVVVGAIMSILDTTIVNIALRTLGRDLHSSLDDVQWVSTGYLLALALVIPLTGWTSERFGARRVWITSVVLFTLGSALCGAAWSLESLVVFRVMQGIGGGMIMPVGMIVLAQAAGPQRMGRVMSIIGVPMLLAPVLGPALGGLIVDNASWRWIFFVNVPIGVIGVVLGMRLLPRGGTHSREFAGRLDFLGLALLSPGLAATLFGLAEVASHGTLAATSAWLPLVAGLALTAAFCVHSLHAERPLIDLRLFRESAFASAAATTFLIGAALFGALLVLPLFFQVAKGYTPLHAGLLLAPQGLGVALAMPFTGVLTDKVGGGKVALVGISVLSIATIPFALLDTSTSGFWLELVLLVRGLGVGATFMPSMAAAYATLDHDAVPRATSALNVIQRVGGSLGTAILAVILQHEIASELPGAASGGGFGAAEGAVPAAARAPLHHAFATTFWWSLVMTLVALVPTIALVRATRKAKTPASAPQATPDPVVG
jgi:EmrB/QacA subfamily drug resistance transporter